LSLKRIQTNCTGGESSPGCVLAAIIQIKLLLQPPTIYAFALRDSLAFGTQSITSKLMVRCTEDPRSDLGNVSFRDEPMLTHKE